MDQPRLPHFTVSQRYGRVSARRRGLLSRPPVALSWLPRSYLPVPAVLRRAVWHADADATDHDARARDAQHRVGNWLLVRAPVSRLDTLAPRRRGERCRGQNGGGCELLSIGRKASQPRPLRISRPVGTGWSPNTPQGLPLPPRAP